VARFFVDVRPILNFLAVNVTFNILLMFSCV